MILDFQSLYIKYNMKIGGVFHIGAHYGQEDKIYKRFGIRNVVYFQPLKKNFLALNFLLKNENVKLVNIALGNQNKQIQMFSQSNNRGQSSSILQPILHLQQYPHIVFDKKQTVKMHRLDDWIQQNKDVDFSQINLINIDVQGYQVQVFKGAQKTLNNIKYIISQVNRRQLYSKCAKVDQVDNFLKRYSFRRRQTNWRGETWGDRFYVKD